MRPLPFTWPHDLVFWAVFLWAFLPEFGIIRRASAAVKQKESSDKGSLQFILAGMWVGYIAGFWLAATHVAQFPQTWRMAVFVTGTVLIVCGSLLRRHCWRVLGASFTGDVRARSDQAVVTAGAYRWLRHPSYTAGIMMNTGLGIALGSWGSALVLLIVSFGVYVYRMSVEERALRAAIGAPYEEFMRTRKRLIPFIY